MGGATDFDRRVHRFDGLFSLFLSICTLLGLGDLVVVVVMVVVVEARDARLVRRTSERAAAGIERRCALLAGNYTCFIESYCDA